MKNQLLKIVVCPLCHTKLSIDIKNNQLICKVDNLFFSIKEGIPIFLIKN